MFTVTRDECLQYALEFTPLAAKRLKRLKDQAKVNRCKAWYGSPPEVLAKMWSDLQIDNSPGRLTEEEDNKYGFLMFLCAHHYIWAFPKNLQIMADTFGVSRCELEGKRFWKWLQKLQSLKSIKIRWTVEMTQEDPTVFLYTLDGIDFLTWEKKNHRHRKQ